MEHQPHISFVRGTIVLPKSLSQVHLDGLPGVKWDERIQAWRAPAHEYVSVRNRLNLQSSFIADTTVKERLPLQGRWRDMPLRPYQEQARNAWIGNTCRGLLDAGLFREKVRGSEPSR